MVFYTSFILGSLIPIATNKTSICFGNDCMSIPQKKLYKNDNYKCLINSQLTFPGHGCQYCLVCHSHKLLVITNPKTGSSIMGNIIKNICKNFSVIWDNNCDKSLYDYKYNLDYTIVMLYRMSPFNRFISGYTELLWRLSVKHWKKAVSDWILRFSKYNMSPENSEKLHELLLYASDVSVNSNNKTRNLQLFDNFVEQHVQAWVYNEHLKLQTTGIKALKFSDFAIRTEHVIDDMFQLLTYLNIPINYKTLENISSKSYKGHKSAPLFNKKNLSPKTEKKICEFVKPDFCCIPYSTEEPCGHYFNLNKNCSCLWVS